ncbi:flavin reductase [Georgenia sp. SYP-B2076]|uniref:flavin reductase n=1 Tax=Georgenia sp. SYP-B2076 TaxID=2495881 RepID=UPI000F8F1CCE|nr:flavin reductase [Georgenia sp. SYP-B2076]
MTIDPMWFREVMSWYPTGVVVVTASGEDGTPFGMVVGTFTSVSLYPPLVGFLPARTSTTWPRIQEVGRFCVNVLGAGQEDLCRAVTRKEPGALDRIASRRTPGGAPILDDAVSWIDCDLHGVSVAGDHYFVTGKVNALDVQAGSLPLLFFQGGYGAFSTPSITIDDPLTDADLRHLDVARPTLERLARTHEAKANATVKVGEQIIMAATAGVTTPAVHTYVGRWLPAVGPPAVLFSAYGNDATREHWLGRTRNPEERADLVRRMEDVRRRGYSLSLRRGQGHAEFERMWRQGLLSRPADELTDEAWSVLIDLPYDPPDASLDDFAEIRSLHAPVLGPQGTAVLGLSLVPGKTAMRTRSTAERWAEQLLEEAAELSELVSRA